MCQFWEGPFSNLFHFAVPLLMLTGRRDVVDLSPFSQVIAQLKGKRRDRDGYQGQAPQE